MNPRLINSLFGLIALAGVGIGVYSWVSTQSSPPTTNPTATPSANQSISPKPTIAPPTSTPTSSPSTVQYSETQNLSIPNRTETLGAGGNLVSIASKYGVTIAQLTKVNNLPNPDKLLAGQTIVVPDAVTSSDYTVLYTLNENRLASERKRVSNGSKSIYNDPITATLADTKSLFGIAADAPFSTNTSDSANSITLTTTNDTWFISVGLEKSADGFWAIKRLIAKNRSKTETSATPQVVL